MQCACPQCDILMAQVAKGITCKCTCPNCLYSCSACLGTNQVLSGKDLAMHANILLANCPDEEN